MNTRRIRHPSEVTIDYGPQPAHRLDLADEILTCLEDCFIGERLDLRDQDRETAVHYISAMLGHAQRMPHLVEPEGDAK